MKYNVDKWDIVDRKYEAEIRQVIGGHEWKGRMKGSEEELEKQKTFNKEED